MHLNASITALILLFSCLIPFAIASPHSRHVGHVNRHDNKHQNSTDDFPANTDNDGLLQPLLSDRPWAHAESHEAFAVSHLAYRHYRRSLHKDAARSLEPRSPDLEPAAAPQLITVITVVLTENISSGQPCITPSATSKPLLTCQRGRACTSTSYSYSCIVVAAQSTSLAASSSLATSTSISTLSSSILSPSAASPSTSSSSPSSPPPAIAVAVASSIKVPVANAVLLLGSSTNAPSSMYIKTPPAPIVQLDAKQYVASIDTGLITGYKTMWAGSGYLELNSSDNANLQSLSTTPRLSRDGGKGGIVNGKKIFLFCDTATFDNNGRFTGFVANSATVDLGNMGTYGKSLTFQDPIGEWDADNGRPRYFVPLTDGEASYNQVMAGQGQRYAIWPDSSLIPLDATSSIVYAPIVWTNSKTSPATFTSVGVTLITVTVPSSAGPVAERTVPMLWSNGNIQWGVIGGIRSWGPSGVGGTDGHVYLFGAASNGLLMARVAAGQVSNAAAYEYWHGSILRWSNYQDDSSTAYITTGAFDTIDIFYSPRHQTFIMVYMNIYVDNTFYWRYLMADTPIVPQYSQGIDMVEALTLYAWSGDHTLFVQQKGSAGYNYAGGVHIGYYDNLDITNGGNKMLLQWTSPSTVDPSTGHGGYDLVTAQVFWY